MAYEKQAPLLDLNKIRAALTRDLLPQGINYVQITQDNEVLTICARTYEGAISYSVIGESLNIIHKYLKKRYEGHIYRQAAGVNTQATDTLDVVAVYEVK